MIPGILPADKYQIGVVSALTSQARWAGGESEQNRAGDEVEVTVAVPLRRML